MYNLLWYPVSTSSKLTTTTKTQQAFRRNCQAASKIYLEIQKSQNSQNIFKNKKKKVEWLTVADFKAIYKATYLKECSICKDGEIDETGQRVQKEKCTYTDK